MQKLEKTGKLYGSITSQMIVDGVKAKNSVEIDRRNIESDPIRSLGEHQIKVRLTMDLTPEIKVIVLREGETIAAAATDESPSEETVEEAVVEAVVEAELTPEQPEDSVEE